MDEVTPEMLAMARRIYAEYVKAKVIEQAGDFDPERIEAIIRGEADITHGVQIALAAIKETPLYAQRTQPSGDEVDLVEDLSNEADLCRNEGADDIAKLLDQARMEITRLSAALAAMDREPVAQPAPQDAGEVSRRNVVEAARENPDARAYTNAEIAALLERLSPEAVRAEERERCAKIVDAIPANPSGPYAKAFAQAAAAIRKDAPDA